MKYKPLPGAYFPKFKNSLKAQKVKKNLKNGKHRGQRKRKRKGAYDKSGGIIHDTAAFNDNPIIKLFQEIELM